MLKQILSSIIYLCSLLIKVAKFKVEKIRVETVVRKSEIG